MSQASEIPARRAAGCIAYTYDQAGELRILLIHDKYGRWALPKGHVQPGESEPDAAAREVHEETGLRGSLGPLVERISYLAQKDGHVVEKQVAFFLMRTDHQAATPQADEGIAAADWFAPAEAQERIGYEQVRAVLARALTMIPD